VAVPKIAKSPIRTTTFLPSQPRKGRNDTKQSRTGVSGQEMAKKTKNMGVEKDTPTVLSIKKGQKAHGPKTETKNPENGLHKRGKPSPFLCATRDGELGATLSGGPGWSSPTPLPGGASRNRKK